MLPTDRGQPQQPEPEISMVDQPFSHRHDIVGARQDVPDRKDWSMDALQYALAFLAIIAVVLLASLR